MFALADSDSDGTVNRGASSRHIRRCRCRRKILLAAGAAVDTAMMDTGDTPLFVASQEGHEAVVSRLIAAGAAVDMATVDDGSTPLFVAVEEGHEAVVGRLIAARAAVDTTRTGTGADGEFGPMVDASVDAGPTALFAATSRGHTAVVQLLLAAGADSTKISPWGTAAEFAARHGLVELAQLLS